MSFELPTIYDAGIASYSEKITTKDRKVLRFEIELPLIKGGVSYIDSEEMDIDTDMIICAKPGQRRHTRFPFKCYYIHLQTESGLLYEKLMNVGSFVKTGRYAKNVKLFEKINYYRSVRPDSGEIMLQGLVLELIFNLIEDNSNSQSPYPADNSAGEFIVEAIKYINSNLDCDLSVEMLAKRSGFSAVYFQKCFKKFTGQTLRRYVEEQRISKAVNMLCRTNCNLTEIAYECGFSSQSYFNYAFKRKTGFTPRGYIRNEFGE